MPLPTLTFRRSTIVGPRKSSGAAHTETIYMPNPFGAPEVTVQEIARRRRAGETFVWLDVREADEVATVAIPDSQVTHLPMSRLARERTACLPAAALDPSAEIVVFCHHGMRSAQVVAWLRGQGWRNAFSMAGGVEAWAHQVDPSIGTY